jgi:hypothetical protein
MITNNKKTLLDGRQLEVLGDQSKLSEPPLLPNYNSRANLTSRSRSPNQPVGLTPVTCIGTYQGQGCTGSHQGQGVSANVDQFSYAKLAEHENEDSSYTDIDITR